MTSHGSNAGDEIERLRKVVQEQDVCINVLIGKASEALSARDQSVPSVSQGTGCTNAQYAEAEATIASLEGKLGASQAPFATSERSFREAEATIASLEEKLGARQATSERSFREAEATIASLEEKLGVSRAAHAASETLFQARQTTLVQMSEDSQVLRTQRRSAIGTMVGMVDLAKSSLDRTEEKDIPFMGNFYGLRTAMQGIHAMGREFLQHADVILLSEFEGLRTYQERIPSIPSFSSYPSSPSFPSFPPPPRTVLGDDQPQDFYAPRFAASPYDEPALEPAATIAPVVPKPPAPRVAAESGWNPLTNRQLPSPKPAAEVVNSWSGTKATNASMAQRLPTPSLSTPSIPGICPASFPPLADKNGSNSDGKSKANTNPMGTEKARQDIVGTATTGAPTPASEELPRVSIFSHIPLPAMSERDARKLANVDEEPEVSSEEEDLYGVSGDEAPKTRKRDVEPRTVSDAKGQSTIEIQEDSRTTSTQPTTPVKPKVPQQDTPILKNTEAGQSEHGTTRNLPIRPIESGKASEKRAQVVSEPATGPTKSKKRFETVQDAASRMAKKAPAYTRRPKETGPPTLGFSGFKPSGLVNASQASKVLRSGPSTDASDKLQGWDKFQVSEAEQKKWATEQAEANKRAGIVPKPSKPPQLPAMKETFRQVRIDEASNERAIISVTRGINHMGRDQAPAAEATPQKEAEAAASTKTADSGISPSEAREDDKLSTDAPQARHQPSVEDVAESLASEEHHTEPQTDEVDIPATSPPGVSAFGLGFDAVSRQSPFYDKTLGLLLRCAYDDSEEEDEGDGSEDEGAHLSAEASPVDTSLPTQSRQGVRVWDIWADENIDIEASKVAGIDATREAGEKAKAEAEKPRKGKHAVKNRKKKEKKKFWKRVCRRRQLLRKHAFVRTLGGGRPISSRDIQAPRWRKTRESYLV